MVTPVFSSSLKPGSSSVNTTKSTSGLDKDLILEIAGTHEALITIEEGAIGGFGSHVAKLLSDHGALDQNFKFRSMCFPDEFLDHGNPIEMYEEAKLNAVNIEEKVLELLNVDLLKTSSSSN